nr:hypothetical protein [Bacillus licheniformis]
MKKNICFFAVMLVCLMGGSFTADSAKTGRIVSAIGKVGVS